MPSRHRTERLMEYDECTGEQSHFIMEDGSDKITIAHVQDQEPIMKVSQNNRNRRGDGWKGDFHHVAFIPGPVLADMQRKGITRDQKEFTRWLNDPDNECFRSKRGRV